MTLPNPFPAISQKVIINTQNNTAFKAKRAGKNGTIIAVVLDESGSMQSVKEPTLNGLNEFIQGQKSASNAGSALVTLVKFDSPDIKTIFENRDIREVTALTEKDYQPNGGTNLLDAIGTTINSVNSYLATIKKADRPGVIITILTDGYENASRSFTNTMIKQMVESCEGKDWTFVFLGANIDAFAAGSQMGFTMQNTVSYDTSNMQNTMSAVSASTIRSRVDKLSGLSTAEIYSKGIFTKDEIQSMNKK